MSIRIFANHAHVFQEEVRPLGTVEKLLDMLDETGIEKAVCYAPICGGAGKQMAELDGNPNRWLAEKLKGSDRLVGFGTVNFTKYNIADQVKEIADLGLKGIKIHPAYQHLCVNGKRAFEAYRVAEDEGLFISFHTGVHWSRLADYSQLLFDDMSYSFPKLKFSLEHIGGYCFFKESVAVMANWRGNAQNPKIYAGWTSIYDRGLWYISDEQLYDLLWMTGDNAQIYGLDFPYRDAAYIRLGIDRILGLDISQESKEKILGGNLRAALGVD